MDEKREIQGKTDGVYSVCGEVCDGRSVSAEGVRGTVAERVCLPKVRRDEVLFCEETQRLPVQQVQISVQPEGGDTDAGQSAVVQNL
jgi:hypothetical protein